MLRKILMIGAILGLIAVIPLTLLFVFHGNSAPGKSPHTAITLPNHATEPIGVPHQIAATPTPVPILTGWRIVIPAIGVNAPIENVGVGSDGNLNVPAKGTPNEWTTAGWYQGGPTPGQRGSAVIDGHLDRPGGYPAVFWNLKLLRVGDTVEVVNPDKGTLHFRVTLLMWYAPMKAPLNAIFSNATGNYLNLITCGGTWIPSQHQTTLRLVVYTELV